MDQSTSVIGDLELLLVSLSGARDDRQRDALRLAFAYQLGTLRVYDQRAHSYYSKLFDRMNKEETDYD